MCNHRVLSIHIFKWKGNVICDLCRSFEHMSMIQENRIHSLTFIISRWKYKYIQCNNETFSRQIRNMCKDWWLCLYIGLTKTDFQGFEQILLYTFREWHFYFDQSASGVTFLRQILRPASAMCIYALANFLPDCRKFISRRVYVAYKTCLHNGSWQRKGTQFFFLFLLLPPEDAWTRNSIMPGIISWKIKTRYSIWSRRLIIL